MYEEWVSAFNEPKLEVSNLGRVRNKDTKRLRTPSPIKNKYLMLVQVENKPERKAKGYYLHRLVVQSFMGEIPKGKEVSHLNGDRTDNRLENLTCETHRENIKRKNEHGTNNDGEKNGAAKLKKEDVFAIRELRKDGKKLLEIARQFNVSFQQISRICLSHNWNK